MTRDEKREEKREERGRESEGRGRIERDKGVRPMVTFVLLCSRIPVDTVRRRLTAVWTERRLG